MKISGSCKCVIAMLMGTMMSAPGYSEDSTFPPSGVDHVLYATSDIERGMDEIEALLGVRPVMGGHHPQYGTHNALLSLGPGIYLEVIARKPELPAPERGALIDIAQDTDSRLYTWVFRSADIEDTAAAAAAGGVELGRVESGSRKKPDGSEINWQLTDPYTVSMDGAVPYVINWGNTTHPSTVVPSGGELVELLIEHPDPDGVRRALRALGADVQVVEGEAFRLVATISTESGLVTLD